MRKTKILLKILVYEKILEKSIKFLINFLRKLKKNFDKKLLKFEQT